MTTVLAVWGAVVSTALGALAVLNYWRDRPNLYISLKTDQSRTGPTTIGLDIANRGRRTTTLMEVGFFADVQTTVRVEGADEDVPVRPKIVVPGTPKALAAGEAAQFRLELVDWPWPIHADDPLRGYALDSHGRMSWGSAMPLLRLVVMGGWRPRRIVHPGMLEPIPGPKIARPVQPQWKFWVHESLRHPRDVSVEGLIQAGVTPRIDVTFGPPGGHTGATGPTETGRDDDPPPTAGTA